MVICCMKLKRKVATWNVFLLGFINRVIERAKHEFAAGCEGADLTVAVGMWDRADTSSPSCLT